MRPVNLIPPEERRGTERTSTSTGALAYAIVGVLVIASQRSLRVDLLRQPDQREQDRDRRHRGPRRRRERPRAEPHLVHLLPGAPRRPRRDDRLAGADPLRLAARPSRARPDHPRGRRDHQRDRDRDPLRRRAGRGRDRPPRLGARPGARDGRLLAGPAQRRPLHRGDPRHRRRDPGRRPPRACEATSWPRTRGPPTPPRARAAAPGTQLSRSSRRSTRSRFPREPFRRSDGSTPVPTSTEVTGEATTAVPEASAQQSQSQAEVDNAQSNAADATNLNPAG